MKIMGFIFICVLFVRPELGFAEGASTDLETSGVFRLRTETNERTDLSTFRSFTSLRIRPAFNFKTNQNFNVYFEPQFSKVMGQPAFVASSATANSQQVTSSVAYDNALSVHQGYIKYLAFEDLTVLAGREALSYGDELVVGALEWNNIGRAFDLVKLRYTHGLGWSDLFSSKVQDSNVTASASGDKDFHGFYNSFNLGEKSKILDLYVFYLRDATGSTPTDLWTMGARTSMDFHPFDFRLEGTKQDNLSEGYQSDLELGWTFSDELKLRMAAESFYATQDYNQLYPTTHKWLGFADVLGRRNISGYALHGKIMPLEKLLLTLSYHDFSRVSTDAPAYKTDGTTALGTATGSSSTRIGNEVDLVAKYALSKQVSLSLGGSLMQPGTYLTDQLGSDKIDFFYGQFDAAF